MNWLRTNIKLVQELLSRAKEPFYTTAPYRNRSDGSPSYQYRLAWEAPNWKGRVACGANRIGKELCDFQTVCMADGTRKTMKEIAIGDYVLSYDWSDGVARPARVINKWFHPKKECYKITFSDGESVYAEGSHPFPVRLRSGSKLSRGKNSRHKIKNGPVQIYRRSVREMIERLDNSVSMRTRMLSPTRVEYLPVAALPIKPYALGAMLGDGSFSSITFHSQDAAVQDRVIAELSEFFVGVTHQTNSFGVTFIGFVSETPLQANGQYQKCDFRKALIALGLNGTTSADKFIPEMYLSASVEDRRQLLAGLVDTDGFKYGFCVKSKRLAEGFQILVRSLGGKATLQQVQKTCTNAKGGPKTGTYWNVTWRLLDLPCEITHKLPAKTKRNCDYSSRIVRSIEPIGVHDCYCIEIDHPDHCFLIGDFVATCNSLWGAFETALMVTGEHPTYRTPAKGIAWVVGLDSKLLASVEKPYFEQFIPERYKLNGKWNGKDNMWHLRADGREWQVWYKSCDSGAKKFQGSAIDYAWVDEEPPDDVMRELELRTVDKQGIWLMTATPVMGTQWLKQTLERDDVYYTMAGMRENPHIPIEEVEKVARQLAQDERDVRIEGKYIIFGGRPVFDRAKLAEMELKALAAECGELIAVA